MQQFIINCYFKEDSLERIPQVRNSHLTYIQGVTFINYGGVIKSAKNEPKGICYVVSVAEYSNAESFVKNDPYYPLYKEHSIARFEQKIPTT